MPVPCRGIGDLGDCGCSKWYDGHVGLRPEQTEAGQQVDGGEIVRLAWGKGRMANSGQGVSGWWKEGKVGGRLEQVGAGLQGWLGGS